MNKLAGWEAPSIVTRIFIVLVVLASCGLGIAFLLGFNIPDPQLSDPETQASVRYHILTALAALLFACLIHAIVLTYLMGTTRWMEETSQAYQLPDDWKVEGRSLKYQTFPGMTFCMFLLIVTGAFGGAADPASPVGFQGWFGISAAAIHMMIAATTLFANLLVNLQQYQVLKRNGQIIDEVLQEVRRIRSERGLPLS